MSVEVNLSIILLASLIVAASPGPATLAIAGTAMRSGRKQSLALASGITTGSLFWSCAAAFGLGAVMLTHAWVLEIIRYCGAGYLMFLALKSARSAMSRKEIQPRSVQGSQRALFGKGLALHLTNPKAILFFGSLYAVGIPAGASPQQLLLVIVAMAVQNFFIFHGYALIFSLPHVTGGYLKLRRWFEGAFALGFGLAGVKILTARLG